MRFTLDAEMNHDGSWRLNIHVPNGETVFVRDVLDAVIVPSLAQLHPRRNERLPTEAEEIAQAAARALPDGWAATADGVNTMTMLGDGGGTSYTRTYQHEDGRTALAPCLADGSSIPATRDALLAVPPKLAEVPEA